MSHQINNESQKRYFEALLSYIDECYIQSDEKMVVYLEAGHFNNKFGVDEFAVNTLNDSIALGQALIKKYQKNVRLVYGILIDDLGLACSDEGCSLNSLPINEKVNKTELPDELEEVIAASSLIKRDKLMVFSERTSKNRAIETIKKQIKNNNDRVLVKEVDEYSEINVSTNELGTFMLARRQGSVFTAKCPAIISQHYKDVLIKLRQRFFEINDFAIIDWSDASDKNKVLQGASAFPVICDTAPLKTSIINVFFGDDEGELTEIRHNIKSTCDSVLV
ncbi:MULTISPECIES: hypothetical protein [unclassified Serratia (in: enterobacteria)]|uniref:hypothetical protein n=1 Tax=unclassified Serratia (in: enterobacteria) TaxID=2647522 RepID=UPI00046B0790|nr:MULTISPECIES: hypothetical protein [unclassified Serratia (in: enterobacteria)]